MPTPENTVLTMGPLRYPARNGAILDNTQVLYAPMSTYHDLTEPAPPASPEQLRWVSEFTRMLTEQGERDFRVRAQGRTRVELDITVTYADDFHSRIMVDTVLLTPNDCARWAAEGHQRAMRARP